MPEKGISITIKKVLGVILAIIGVVLLIEPGLLTQWNWWNAPFAVILFISAYFLIIAGRQLGK